MFQNLAGGLRLIDARETWEPRKGAKGSGGEVGRKEAKHGASVRPASGEAGGVCVTVAVEDEAGAAKLAQHFVCAEPGEPPHQEMVIGMRLLSSIPDPSGRAAKHDSCDVRYSNVQNYSTFTFIVRQP